MSRVEEIGLEISKLYNELHTIREQCSHPPICRTYKYGSNTGNYDPHADAYWINHECTLCGKAWTTDQEPENHAPEGAKKLP